MAAAIWFALTQIYAIGMGAYIAARLRPRVADGMEDEVRFRDGITGVTVWALAIVLGLVIAGMAASSAARTGAAVVGSAAGTAARQIDPAYTVDLLLRPAAAQNGQQPAAGRGQGREITAAERDQISRIVVNSLAQGSIPQADQQYLTQIIADRTGVPREEAERRITQTYEQAKATALGSGGHRAQGNVLRRVLDRFHHARGRADGLVERHDRRTSSRRWDLVLRGVEIAFGTFNERGKS